MARRGMSGFYRSAAKTVTGTYLMHRAKEKPHHATRLFDSGTVRQLDVERRSAAAGALHIGVFELEAGALERFDVIDAAAVQIHDGSGIHENLQAVHVEGLVHHAGG